MSFQEQKIGDTISLVDTPNEPFVAYYIGSREVSTTFGEQMVHDFQKKDGELISVWGFTSLDRMLAKTNPGVLCKITYTGKSKAKNKRGNHYHTCTLFFDNEDTIESPAAKEQKTDAQPDDTVPF